MLPSAAFLFIALGANDCKRRSDLQVDGIVGFVQRHDDRFLQASECLLDPVTPARLSLAQTEPGDCEVNVAIAYSADRGYFVFVQVAYDFFFFIVVCPFVILIRLSAFR